MYGDDFAIRLTQLRNQKGVTARDMSLCIGQNPGYINNIETCKALPSMSAFFYICEYLEITPQEFFDTDSQEPETIRRIVSNLKKLDSQQLHNIDSIVQELVKK